MKTKPLLSYKLNFIAQILLAIIASAIVLSGCSTYQYAALDSELEKDENSAFINENDTVKILYSFTGRNCPVTIQVFNKLQKAIYIDWSKSAIILDGRKISYWIDKSELNASSSGHEYQWTKDYSSTHSEINGTLYRDERISFIPPQSFISITRINLRSNFFKLTKEDRLTDEYRGTTSGRVKLTNHTYDEATSPLSFRSYITLSTNDDFSSEINFDNQFWVESVAKSGYAPDALINKPANQFHLRKASVGGKIFGWTAVLTALTLLAIYGGEQ